MAKKPVEVIVAGHICLDILPTFAEHTPGHEMLVPGKLIDVGPAVLAVGGAVANTGLALHRLGVSTRLIGKVGDDPFGHLILNSIREHDPTLAEEMLVTDEAKSSYSLVISPPGVDRIFLHHAGANDAFRATDIRPELFRDARLFHFGYPPIMRHFYADGGETFAALLRELKAYGLTTTLDMALPDPSSAAGRVNWVDWLTGVLPYVDIFLPSSEEILAMLGYTQAVDGPLLSEVAEQLLAKGAAIVALKLGSDGFYMRTTGDVQRLAGMGKCAPRDLPVWRDRELLAPCFQVDVAGTTGAGDCTIAGYLAGLLQGLPPEAVMTGAVAVGACGVEAADATSGVPTWSAVQARMQAGWRRCPVGIELLNWQYDTQQSLWRSPHDCLQTGRETFEEAPIAQRVVAYSMHDELNIESPAVLTGYLRQIGWIGTTEEPAISVLAGGVSNRTVLVERPSGEAWVLKQALEKLRVAVDWFSSPTRIHHEALGVRWLADLAPAGTTTRFLFEDHEHHILAMEAVPQPHTNWKTLLLAGQLSLEHIEQFGSLLGTIHRRAYERQQEIASIFGDTSFFESLRIEPYYTFTATQVPEAASFLYDLIDETRACRFTLVHGDYSPKNILVYRGKLLLLDHEVIHYGDPAFDVGFSLTHFLSKAHHMRQKRQEFADAAGTYWTAYRQHIADLVWSNDLESRVVRHTIACLLARVAGRSPLEYLDAIERRRQHRVVVGMLERVPGSLLELVGEFIARIENEEEREQ